MFIPFSIFLLPFSLVFPPSLRHRPAGCRTISLMTAIGWLNRLRTLLTGGPQGASVEEAARLRAEVVWFYGEDRLADATEAARRLVEWQRQTLGEGHPDYFQGLSNLAQLLQKQGGDPPPAPAPALPVADPRAIAVLDRVLALRLAGLGELAALGDCQRAARALRSEIATGGRAEDAGRLADGAHPLASLLALIGPAEALGDARWADLHHAVREAFGQPLATAASRGQVREPPP